MSEPTTLFFSALGFILFLVGSKALLVSVVVASIFQAAAFLNVSNSPIIIYYFFCALFLLRSLLDILWNKNVIVWAQSRNAPFYWLMVFATISILGAIWLPQAFDGFMVYSPKLSIDDQYNNLTQLTLGSSNFNQIAQIVINSLVFFIIWLRGFSPYLVLRAIYCAFAVAVTFSIWQLASNVGGFYYPEEWLYTVEGWNIGNQQALGSFSRINATFLEPSGLSTYLVGIFAYCLVTWVKRPSWLAFTGILLAVFCMIITTSTTAYLGLILVVSAVFLGFAMVQIVKGGWIDKTLFGVFLAILVSAWLVSIAVVASNDVQDLVDLVFTLKSEGDSFRVRLDADVKSIEVLTHTYGLGLGLGSSRPSSFFAFLASNVGVVGLLAFIMFTFTLSKNAIHMAKESVHTKLSTFAIATVWALWATIMAKAIAQPDLTFAPLWIWLYLLAAFCTHHQQCLADRT